MVAATRATFDGWWTALALKIVEPIAERHSCTIKELERGDTRVAKFIAQNFEDGEWESLIAFIRETAGKPQQPEAKL